MKRIFTLILLTVSLQARTQIQTLDLARYVNPFIGTAEGMPGNETKDNAYTNPGAVVPWGMISITPFNIYDPASPDKRRPSAYIHGKEAISGFTHVNLSGVGCNELGVFCLMPTTGEYTPGKVYNSSYSNEQASPGYYSVRLNDYRVKVELATTLRTSISRYTFPKGRSHVILNVGLGLTEQKGAFVRRISDTEVEGFKMLGNMCGRSFVNIIYFYAKLSKAPMKCDVWIHNRLYENYQREVAGDDVGAVFTYETQENETIEVKLGISYVSTENARKNVEAEVPSFDFDGVRQAAREAWNKELSRIIVEGGSENDKVKFYTALYHSLIHPNIYNDANGEYQKFQSTEKGRITDYERYTLFSLWDTYRFVHPFYSLVFPDKATNMVKSLLDISDENGFLPRWTFGGQETGAMVGDPSLPVIADTWLRGVRDFDINRAYKAMKHNALTPEQNNYMRPGMTNWLKYGYIPEDASLGVWGSVSTALEYCIADWNLAQLAKALGKTDDYKLFLGRSMLYKNNFDPQTGFMRPRNMDGQWVTPFITDSHKQEQGFTEGNTWNYTFMVPHDIPGLMHLIGGSHKFTEKLEECFAKEYFDITNEPDLAYPWLFNYVKGEEWRTQKHVRRIINNDFSTDINGLPGNDDCGTMSTWLMFAMMGFYPSCPGNMDYQLSAPVFDKITIYLNPRYYHGGSFVIETENAGKDNCYIKAIELNGKKHPSYSISHNDIIKGGNLKFILSSKLESTPKSRRDNLVDNSFVQ